MCVLTRVRVPGAVFGAVDDRTGDFFEYPPLRNHRTHLTYLSKASPVLWEKHSDSQCTAAEGGTDCYIEVLPPGYALEARACLPPLAPPLRRRAREQHSVLSPRRAALTQWNV